MGRVKREPEPFEDSAVSMELGYTAVGLIAVAALTVVLLTRFGLGLVALGLMALLVLAGGLVMAWMIRVLA